MNNSYRQLAAIAAVLWLSAGLAFAQATGISLGTGPNDSQEPIEITSDELRVDLRAGVYTFVGNVIIGQGEMRLTADTVVAELAESAETGESEYKAIRASGGVTVVGTEEAAEAQSLVYTPSDATVVMTGDVLVTQGPTVLTADRLIYNLDTGEGRMEGRVKTVLQAGRN